MKILNTYPKKMLIGTGLLASGEGQGIQISSEVSVPVFILSEPEYWNPPPSTAVTTAHLCCICVQNFNTKVVQLSL